MSRRLLLIRTIVLATALLGVNYVAWRWFASVSWSYWWIAVPLVLAETYSLIDSLLFGFGMLRLRERGQPPDAPEGLTVDVFITTYNEPLELVERTAVAACAIRYPHRTWILDDGNREEMRELAQRLDVGWITRSADWAGHARHAKAGNLNNALLATDGEFLLILDADQVPSPEILHRTLGYFADEGMALVQTPQWFENVPDHDPLGSQAPLFYGPIQQSKDGWNSAYFCGSNAVIRREALMLLGVSGYVGEVELGVQRALSAARTVVRRALRGLGPEDVMVRDALEAIEYEVGKARRRLGRGEALFDVTYRFQERVAAVRRRLVAADLEALHADLAVIAELDGIAADPDLGLATIDEGALRQMSQRDFSPLGAVDAVEALVRAVDVDRGEEAQAVMPMATISVTEDMATCMRLHTLGWRTAYHDEVLAVGLAPEDLQTMLTQRLRWAQGTIQVMLRENPLTQRGLNLAQRLMYFGTMWSYLAGFAALIYIAAPVLYLVFGVLPVQAFSADFFWRLDPVPPGQPAALPGGRRRTAHVARPAVLAGALPRVDPLGHLGRRQRLVRPVAGLRGHAEDQADPGLAALAPRQAAALGDGDPARRRRDRRRPARRRPGRTAGHRHQPVLGRFRPARLLRHDQRSPLPRVRPGRPRPPDPATRQQRRTGPGRPGPRRRAAPAARPAAHRPDPGGLMIEFGVDTTSEGIGVVTPRGRLNMVSARRLKDLLAEMVADGTTKIVVDMGETTFLDSSGLGALIAGLKSARQAGGDLRVARPTPAVHSVFEMTNLDRVLRARDTVEGAFDA